jgi:hypothetical protein
MATFCLPANFHPQLYFTGKESKLCDRACYVVHLLTLAASKLAETDERGYRRLDSRALRNMLGGASTLIVRTLESAGVIDVNHYYSVWSHEAKGYRLTRKYLASHCVTYTPTDPQLLAKLAERRRIEAEAQVKLRLPIHDLLHQNETTYLSVDRAEADGIIAEMYRGRRLHATWAASAIEQKTQPSILGGTSRRMFNGLTCAPRLLRNAMRLDGQPLASWDLKSSQPALLANLLTSTTAASLFRATYRERDEVPLWSESLAGLPWLAGDVAVPCDVELFAQLTCCPGDLDFYQFLAVELRLPAHCPSCRAQIKRMFMREVLARRGNRWRRMRRICERNFPTVTGFIAEVNKARPGLRRQHANLVQMLQRFESFLVIENVCPLLVEQCPVVPLHDSVYVRPCDLPLAEQAFEAAFLRLDIKMRLEKECYPKTFKERKPCGHFDLEELEEAEDALAAA